MDVRMYVRAYRHHSAACKKENNAISNKRF